MSAGDADVEAYVGRALRLMASELHAELARLLQNSASPVSSDPYDILRCLIDKTKRPLLPQLSEQNLLGGAYRVLELRNRWAHPRTHEPMEPDGAIHGIDSMIAVVRAFGCASTSLEALREDLRVTSGTAAPPNIAAVQEECVASDAGLDDSAEIDEEEVTARMTLRPGTGPAYAAAVVVRLHAFEADGSIFGAPTPVWTSANLAKLLSLLLDGKARGIDDFVSAYRTQLAGQSREVVQLAGEALYVHLWINAKSISGDTKRSAIDRVLSCHPDCVAMPPAIARALDMGLVRTGASFHQWRWHYLQTVVGAALGLHRMATPEQRKLMADPWRFRDWLMSDTEGAAQRHALLHLLYPDTFEAIISAEDKQRIVARFRDRLTRPPADVDRGLFALRRELAPEFGPRYDYYRPPVIGLWR